MQVSWEKTSFQSLQMFVFGKPYAVVAATPDVLLLLRLYSNEIKESFPVEGQTGKIVPHQSGVALEFIALF
jgi:hypothetical protein